MNIKYHFAVSTAGSLIYGPLFFIAGMAPDLTLARNEYKLWKYKLSFKEDAVSLTEWHIYMMAHSLFCSGALFLIDYRLGLGHLFHIIPDWFTHKGRFSALPFYPYQGIKILCGKNILK